MDKITVVRKIEKSVEEKYSHIRWSVGYTAPISLRLPNDPVHVGINEPNIGVKLFQN